VLFVAEILHAISLMIPHTSTILLSTLTASVFLPGNIVSCTFINKDTVVEPYPKWGFLRQPRAQHHTVSCYGTALQFGKQEWLNSCESGC
jgi:hypothetical protein